MWIGVTSNTNRPSRISALIAVMALMLAMSVVGASPATAAETPAPNPPIAKQCGINITLILDASGSVQSSNAVGAVRTAASAFLDALQDTGSTARVIQFASIAQELAPRGLVTAASVDPSGSFGQAVKGYYNPIPPRPSGVEIKSYKGSGSIGSAGSWTSANNSNQYTNWNQVLDLTATDPGDLVVFITDGDPTSYDFDRPGDPFTTVDVAVNTDRGEAAASTLDRAIESANAIKNQGTRVLALGVGAALQNPASVDRLTKVSGPVVARTTAEFDIETTDVALVSDFDDLADAVRGLVLELCSPSLTIRKFAQSAGDASYRPAPGWDVTVTPTVPGGTFAWVLPTGASGALWTLPTDANGFAQFQWEPSPAENDSTAQVSEALQANFTAGRPTADDFRCELKDAKGNTRTVSGELTGGGNPSFTLDPIGQEIVTCALWNSFAYAPEIALTKVNSPTEVRGDLSPPASVRSAYQATNPGNTPLSGVTITDDKCGPVNPVLSGSTNVGDTNADGRLDPGETWRANCDREAIAAKSPAGGINVVNTATVVGIDPVGTIVTDTATDDVDVFVPAIELTKLVNGQSEVTVVNGTPVTYTYAVANTGNTPLATPVLADDTPPCESPIRGADAPGNDDAILDVGETWTYSCTAGPEEPVVNTATVTATPLNPLADPIVAFPDPNPDVTATDSASVTTTDPGLVLTKDADQDLVFTGSDVTYDYTAENTGDSDLRNDTGAAGWVTDDQCSPVEQVVDGSGNNTGDVNADDLLNPGETWDFTCTAVIAEDTVNVAGIAAQPVDPDGEPIGNPLIRSAIDMVQVVDPEIQLTKTALVPVVLDPDATPIAGPDVPTPRLAEYLYEVANPGTVPLSDVEVTDDRCAPLTLVDGDPNSDKNLDVDEVWTYSCTTALDRDQATPPVVGAESGLVTNTATVTGTPFLPGDPPLTGPAVSDTDIAQVLVIEPSLTLTKTASADVVRADAEVTYSFAVANTGDVGLEVLGPVDDKCADLTFTGGDANGNDLLDGADSAAPETWNYTCLRSVGLPAAPETSDTNTANVVGIDPLGNAYVAEDSAQVQIIDPAIRLVKTVSQTLVPTGTQVSYGFAVTNVGDSPVPTDDVLGNVTLVDVANPAAPSCTSPTLVAKEGGNQDDFLDREPAETWRYACSTTITAPTNNVAIVVGTGGSQFGLSLLVADLDAAFVQPFTPGIEVVKTADPTTLLGEGDVTYTYQVRNTGNVPLSGVAARISDDTCAPVSYVAGDDDADGLLDTPTSLFEDAADETWTFTCTTTVAETTTNVVTVPGTPSGPDGLPLCGPFAEPTERTAGLVNAPCDVTGEGTATVTVVQPGTVTIVKQTTTSSATAFSFTFGDQTFTLTDGQSQTITEVPPGSYTVSEAVSSSWRLDSVVCADPTDDSPYFAGSAGLTVSVAEGEEVTCVFTNEPTTSGGGTLPDTGLGISWRVLVAGFGLVGFGVAMVLAAARPRSQQ